MNRARWLAALGFGTLNTALFLLVSGQRSLPLLRAWWIGLVLWAALIVASHWTIGVADDLRRISAREAAGLLVRGAIAGIGAGALVMAVAALPDWGFVGTYAAFGAYFGMFVGVGLAIVDALVLAGVRVFLPARV